MWTHTVQRGKDKKEYFNFCLREMNYCRCLNQMVDILATALSGDARWYTFRIVVFEIDSGFNYKGLYIHYVDVGIFGKCNLIFLTAWKMYREAFFFGLPRRFCWGMINVKIWWRVSEKFSFTFFFSFVSISSENDMNTRLLIIYVGKLWIPISAQRVFRNENKLAPFVDKLIIFVCNRYSYIVESLNRLYIIISFLWDKIVLISWFWRNWMWFEKSYRIPTRVFF